MFIQVGLSQEVELIFLCSGPTISDSKTNHCNERQEKDKNVIEASLQGQQTLSVKGQIVNSLGFEVHMVSVATTELCHYSRKAAIDNT